MFIITCKVFHLVCVSDIATLSNPVVHIHTHTCWYKPMAAILLPETHTPVSAVVAAVTLNAAQVEISALSREHTYVLRPMLISWVIGGGGGAVGVNIG